MHPADRLPVEIWLTVFSHAFTDGGPTACAVSLVSNRFKQISERATFHTVAIDGAHRLRCLLRDLKARPPPARNVRHICLTDAQNQGIDHGREDVDALLALVSTSVESLCVGRPWKVRFETFLPAGVQLTALRDLALCGDYVSALTSEIEKWHTAAPNLTFPALRRVHLYGLLSGTAPLGVIARAAPCLQRLRISGVNADYQFPVLLGQALGVYTLHPNMLRGTDRTPLPETVRCVSVETYARGPGRPCYGDQKHEAMWNGFEALPLENMREGLKLRLLFPGRYGEADLVRDWFDIIGGGEGCWDESCEAREYEVVLEEVTVFD